MLDERRGRHQESFAVDELVACVVRPSQVVGIGVALFLAQCESHDDAPVR